MVSILPICASGKNQGLTHHNVFRRHPGHLRVLQSLHSAKKLIGFPLKSSSSRLPVISRMEKRICQLVSVKGIHLDLNERDMAGVGRRNEGCNLCVHGLMCTVLHSRLGSYLPQYATPRIHQLLPPPLFQHLDPLLWVVPHLHLHSMLCAHFACLCLTSLSVLQGVNR